MAVVSCQQGLTIAQAGHKLFLKMFKKLNDHRSGQHCIVGLSAYLLQGDDLLLQTAVDTVEVRNPLGVPDLPSHLKSSIDSKWTAVSMAVSLFHSYLDS